MSINYCNVRSISTFFFKFSQLQSKQLQAQLFEVSGTIYSKYMILQITDFFECFTVQIKAYNSRSCIGMWNCPYRTDQLLQ